jgi:hypothetical protein
MSFVNLRQLLFISVLWMFGSLSGAVKSNSGSIEFFPDSSQGRKAVLDSEGKLAIGDFQPSANLHVKGNVIFESGNVWLNSTIKVSQTELGGTLGRTYSSINSDTVLSISDSESFFFVDTSSDNLQITLPDAENVNGRQYEFKKISVANRLRISSASNIDGFNSQVEATTPSNGLSHLKMMSDGNQWFLLDKSDDVTNLVAAANLIGWWKLDETEGTTASDSSGYGNHGILGGAGATFSDNNIIGRLGGGLNFDTQNNYIDVTGMTGLPSQQITVSCWAYVTENQNWSRFMNHEWVGNGWLLYAGSNGEVRFGIGQGGVQTNAVSPNYTILLNHWFFLVGTYDSNDVKVYFNGSLMDTTANVGATLDNVGDINISKSSSINGMMDDIRIYDRALTQDEILHLYREGLH